MDLRDCKPGKNQVLIKMESNESIKLDSGHVIFCPPKDKQQNDQEFVPLRGEVIAVPECLWFKQGNHLGLKWRTEIDLEAGDKVIMKRPALAMALSKDQGSWFEENGEVYVYLRYDEIILAKRGEEVIVLNGFVIVAPLEVNFNTSLYIPDTAKKNSMFFGHVRYIGKPNKEYHITKNSKHEQVIQDDSVFWVRKEGEEIKIDQVELQVGDLVQFPKSSAIQLEQDAFRTLAGKDQVLYRMQRFNIIVKL